VQHYTTNMPIYFTNNPNLLTVSWTTGSGSTGMFNQNGSTDENVRVNGTDPWGNSAVVWETRPNGSSADDGGWNTSWFNIDRTKLYRFSVWVKRTSSTTGGTFYLGMYDNVVVNKILDDGTEGNPYWSCSNISWLTQNTWYLVVGHVFPTNTRTRINHPDTGHYTVSGGVAGRGNIDFCNISGDLRWNASATQALHRTYHYYCPDNTSRLQFYDPRVDLCDGSEPSIDDLLNNRMTRRISSKSNRRLVLDGSTREKAAPDPTYLYKHGVTTNGMYFLNPGGLGVNRFYIDFTYKPGSPMTMVISNRWATGGVGYATYARCTGPWVNPTGTYDANLNFNLWVGLDYWRYLGDTILQGVKGPQASYSSGTHNAAPGSMDRLAKWKFAGFTSTYAFKYARDYSNLIGSTTAGLYGYHAVNEYSLTTYDQDQDVYGDNCSTSYGNKPWWYGACWDGNYFGFDSGPYWSGSSGDHYAYGAIYIGWYDSGFDTL
jgi:hypothetical protein